MNREKSCRRHQEYFHMWRRLKEDRNQHYDNLFCLCWTDLKAMARFKSQPKICSCSMCCNPRNRKSWNKGKVTIPEIKNLESFYQQMKDL